MAFWKRKKAITSFSCKESNYLKFLQIYLRNMFILVLFYGLFSLLGCNIGLLNKFILLGNKSILYYEIHIEVYITHKLLVTAAMNVAYCSVSII